MVRVRRLQHPVDRHQPLAARPGRLVRQHDPVRLPSFQLPFGKVRHHRIAFDRVGRVEVRREHAREEPAHRHRSRRRRRPRRPRDEATDLARPAREHPRVQAIDLRLVDRVEVVSVAVVKVLDHDHRISRGHALHANDREELHVGTISRIRMNTGVRFRPDEKCRWWLVRNGRRERQITESVRIAEYCAAASTQRIVRIDVKSEETKLVGIHGAGIVRR